MASLGTTAPVSFRMTKLVPDREARFPNLHGTPYHVTSGETSEYNCVAWAAGDTERWWWPRRLSYWPGQIPREETLSAFRQAFELLGYEVCSDGSLEGGYEKVALFVDARNTPTHAARQLPNGSWTSKLGDYEDIEHQQLMDVGNGVYGAVAVVLRRQRST